MISPLTPLDFLARSVHAWRDLTAIVEGDRRFTYAEFGARVERQAAALLQLGVQAGDRVATFSRTVSPAASSPAVTATEACCGSRPVAKALGAGSLMT